MKGPGPVVGLTEGKFRPIKSTTQELKMKTTLIIASAVLGLGFAGGAHAQVLGGVGGNVGGNVGGGVSVTRGNLGVRDTLGSARDLARDTVSGSREAVREAGRLGGDASLEASASGGVSLDRNGASVDFSSTYGAEVNSRSGETLGRAVGLAQDTAAGTRYVLVQGTDGVVRGVLTTELEVEADGALDSNLTAYAFRRLPQQGSTPPGASPEPGDDGRRDPRDSDTDQIY